MGEAGPTSQGDMMPGVERFRWALLALALAVALHPAAAQSRADTSLKPLALPIGKPLLCDRKDSASLSVFKLRIGDELTGSRNIEAAYDSLGRARMLIDWGTASGRIEMVEAEFDTLGVIGFGFHRLDSLPSLNSHQNQGRLPPLTSADQARAKNLTAWIWNHRCFRAGK
jgi:hypothetical protein